MSQERRLQDTEVLEEQGWRDAAYNLLLFEWWLDSEAEIHGTGLADAVVGGVLSVPELRAGISWANAHDKEVVEKVGDLDQLEKSTENLDLVEATARRLAHHAGRWALKRVKTEDSRILYARERREARAAAFSAYGVGLFMLEPKDLAENISRIRIVR